MEEQDDPPKPLEEKGKLYQDLFPVWNAFWVLSTSRVPDGGIPMADTIAYWRELMGIVDRDELKEKVLLIQAMDAEFLRAMREKKDGV
tara:strand:- start:2590 stop:2853 length:264 start_codon:yes stop_codon:yes gene_type:complete